MIAFYITRKNHVCLNQPRKKPPSCYDGISVAVVHRHPHLPRRVRRLSVRLGHGGIRGLQGRHDHRQSAARLDVCGGMKRSRWANSEMKKLVMFDEDRENTPVFGGSGIFLGFACAPGKKKETLVFIYGGKI